MEESSEEKTISIVEDITKIELNSLRDFEKTICYHLRGRGEIGNFYQDGHCKIWGRKGVISIFREKISKDVYVQYFSLRAGGFYFVKNGVLEENISKDTLSLERRSILTTWLIEERKKGFVPIITKDTLKIVGRLKSSKSSEKAEKLLNFIVKKYSIGTHISLYTKGRYYNKYEFMFDKELLLAYSESETLDELLAIVEYLRDEGWVKFIEEEYAGSVVLTLEGKIATEQVTNEDSDEGFVAMWFDESMNSVSKAITKGIERAGYKAVRIDNLEHNKKIDDEIIAAIRRARFIVADFTHGKTGARGGVYYEAGFAHGLGIEVIFTCREDIVEDIHFDTRQYNHITWTEEKLDDLTEQIAHRISATINDGPHKVKHTS